jgi:hypothetical protein
MEPNIKIKTIEAGYAKVYDASGRFLGSLHHDTLAGTGRSGMWFAETASKMKAGFGFSRQEALDSLLQFRKAKGLS